MKKNIIIGLLLSLFLFIFFCSSNKLENKKEDSYISVDFGNYERTSAYPFEGPTKIKGVKWKFDLGERAPYYKDGKEIIEKRKLAYKPFIYDSMIYFYSGKFYALNKYTGNIVWKIGGHPLEILAGYNGSLIMYGKPENTKGRGYMSVDAKTGKLNWYTIYKYDINNITFYYSGSAVYKNYLIFIERACQADEIAVYKEWGYVKALDMDNGTIAWSMKFDGGFSDNQYPVISDGKLYVYGLDKTYKNESRILYAIDLEKRQIIWERKIDNGFKKINFYDYDNPTNMLATESSIICISNIGELICVDKNNGKINWIIDIKNDVNFYDNPFYIENKLYSFIWYNTFVLIDLKNGKIIKEYKPIDKGVISGTICFDKKFNLYTFYGDYRGPKNEYNLLGYNLNNDMLILSESLLELVKAIKEDSDSIISIYVKNLVLDNSKQVYFEYNGWLYALEGE